jgi:hypothetical protein
MFQSAALIGHATATRGPDVGKLGAFPGSPIAGNM